MAESSFDVVSSVDLQEVKNAIGQAMKEITTRFDLKGTSSNIELVGEELILTSGDDSPMKAVRDVLKGPLVDRNKPLNSRTFREIQKAQDATALQTVTMHKRLPTGKARA